MTEYTEVLRLRCIVFEKQILLGKQFDLKEISAKELDQGIDNICKFVKSNIELLTEYENHDNSIYLDVKSKVEDLLKNRLLECNGRPNIPWPAGYTPPAYYKAPSLPHGYHPKEVWYDRTYSYVDEKNIPPIVWTYVRDSSRLTRTEKLTQ